MHPLLLSCTRLFRHTITAVLDQGETVDKTLNNRKSMIKVPSSLSVHIDESGNIVLTFSNGTDEEYYSFMLSKTMTKELSGGLITASEMALETPITIN